MVITAVQWVSKMQRKFLTHIGKNFHDLCTRCVGKAKQSAKTEIEKLKLSEMTCKELVKEAARIIYLVHDELKDKQFELEMSWVGEHTNGRHERVPAELKTEAEMKARQAMAEDSDSDTEDM